MSSLANQEWIKGRGVWTEYLSQTEKHLQDITQVVQEIHDINKKKIIFAVRNPTAWANGTTPEVVLHKNTNKIFNPGIHNQGNS